MAKTYEALSPTPPSVGPGSYALEQPRYKSFHAAYGGGGLQVWEAWEVWEVGEQKGMSVGHIGDCVGCSS